MNEKININTADADTLSQLNGVAQALAARIIEYRETVHPFEEVIELAAVPGISERMVRQFEDAVTVGDLPADVADAPEEAETAVLALEPGDASPDPITPELALPAQNEPDEEEAVVEAASADESPELDVSAVDLLEDERPEADGAAENPSEVGELEVSEQEDDDQDADLPETDILAEEGSEAEDPQVDEEVPAEPAAPLTLTSLDAPAARSTEEPEQVMTDERQPQPAPPLAASAPSGDAIPRRRGCLFTAIGALLGAALGAAVTLGILAAINGGSLQYARSNSQLRLQLDTVNQSMDDLSAELDNSTQQLNVVATRAAELADEQRALNSSLEAAASIIDETQGDLSDAQTEIETLAETAVALDERIDTVSAAAETFDTFLTGMRDLLVDLQGMPVPTRTPFGTETPEGTAASGTPAASETETAVTATPAATRMATRTPRPTATPIALKTPTPAQQP